MKNFLLTILLTIPVWSFAQSPADDELTFEAAIDWLDRKLNYIYYEEAAQKWWLNKFYVNDNKEVTIKNIFTDKPRSANIKEKTYLIRTFKMEDINPYHIDINEIHTDQGRIVKGKLLELKTYSGNRAIHKTVNGRKGTDVSFVQISFPTFMTDSIADYAELVRAKFKEAIIAATKVYPTGNLEEDKATIFELIQGNFFTESGQKLNTIKKFENVISLNAHLNNEQYFGYDPKEQVFYYTTLSSDGVIHDKYRLIGGHQLMLKHISDDRKFITFETKNSIRIHDTVYYRE